MSKTVTVQSRDWQAMREIIQSRGSFEINGGNMRGGPVEGEGDVTYRVYSYAEPIAQLSVDGSWWFDTKKWSVTTSKHQSMAWRACNW